MYPVDSLSTFWTTGAWWSLSANHRQNPFSWPSLWIRAMVGLLKKAIAHLLIRLKGNSKRISGYLLSPLDAQDMDLWLLRRRSCPFRKRSLPFLRQSAYIKKKENRNSGSNLNLGPGPWYPNLSSLPLHYHSLPAKIPKWNSVHTIANCLS